MGLYRSGSHLPGIFLIDQFWGQFCSKYFIICVQENAPFCISKFAENTKPEGAVDSFRATSQAVLDELKHWTKVNDTQCEFKCQILHLENKITLGEE